MGRCSGTHLVVVDDVLEFGGLVLVQREQSQVEQGLCAQTANRDEIMKRCYICEDAISCTFHSSVNARPDTTHRYCDRTVKKTKGLVQASLCDSQ